MKDVNKKDLLYIGLTIVILAVVGVVAYGQFAGGTTASEGVSVEVIHPIDASFDQSALDRLRDQDRSRDFTVPVDVKSGAGNSTPFGSL